MRERRSQVELTLRCVRRRRIQGRYIRRGIRCRHHHLAEDDGTPYRRKAGERRKVRDVEREVSAPALSG